MKQSLYTWLLCSSSIQLFSELVPYVHRVRIKRQQSPYLSDQQKQRSGQALWQFKVIREGPKMCHLSQESRMKRNQLCGGLEYTLWTEKTASTMSMSIEYLSQPHNPQNACVALRRTGVHRVGRQLLGQQGSRFSFKCLGKALVDYLRSKVQ